MNATAEYIAEREKKILAEIMDVTSSNLYKEAFLKGYKKGYKKGYEKGYEKGVHNTTVRITKKLLEKDMSIIFITEVVEVSKAFVQGVIAETITEIE